MTMLGDAAAQSDRQTSDRQAKVQLINGHSISRPPVPCTHAESPFLDLSRRLYPACGGGLLRGHRLHAAADAGGIRRLCRRHQHRRHSGVDFRGTAMVAFALTVVAMCAATPLVFLFRSDVSVELVLASMFVAIMSNAVDVGQEFERAKLRPYRFAAISIVRSVSSVGFGLLGIWLGWGGMGLLAAFGLGSLTGIILNLVGDRTKIAHFSRGQFMQLARYGLPLTLAGLSVALYSTSDRLIVAWLLGKDAAGIFGVAADLPRQFMVMIASSVAAATVPLVFRSLSEKNDETTRERLSESLELLLVVVAPVAVW